MGFLRNIAVGAMKKAPWLETAAVGLGLPEWGISEQANNWQPSRFTGYTPSSQQAGMLDWRNVNFPSTGTAAKTPIQNIIKTAPQIQAPAGGGGGPFQPSQPSYDPYAQLRGEISSGWDAYINSLDAQLGTLGTQRASQENIVGSQFTQGVGSLSGQRDISYQGLEMERAKIGQNQTKNLRDLAANITNAMRAGNIYLGSRGAGDSSASNMYSYALSKLGTQERSNVMQNTANLYQDLNNRKWQIDQIYNQETNNLAYERDQKIQEVALWYSDATRQIQRAKASGQFQKDMDLSDVSREYLNMGVEALNQISTSFGTKMSLLQQWGEGKTGQVADIISRIQKQGTTDYSYPQIGNMVGTPQVSGLNMFTPAYGGSYSDEEKYRQLG